MPELYLAHHGILGQKWGVRRFQNPDGTLTDAGKKRISKKQEKEIKSGKFWRNVHNNSLKNATEELNSYKNNDLEALIELQNEYNGMDEQTRRDYYNRSVGRNKETGNERFEREWKEYTETSSAFYNGQTAAKRIISELRYETIDTLKKEVARSKKNVEYCDKALEALQNINVNDLSGGYKNAKKEVSFSRKLQDIKLER